MIVIAITGGIAMGKSNTARDLERLGVPVGRSDEFVHRLLAGEAADSVAAAFPDVLEGGRIDRARLAGRVFGDESALAKLESILHPGVRRLAWAFIRRAARQGRSRVALEIPLLFETGGERRADIVATVSAPAFLQRQRALARPGMDEKRLAAILRRQLPDAVRRAQADLVIRSGLGRRFALRDTLRLLTLAKRVRARVWPKRHARNRPRYRIHGA